MSFVGDRWVGLDHADKAGRNAVENTGLLLTGQDGNGRSLLTPVDLAGGLLDASRAALLAKRTIDIALSLFALAVLTPVLTVAVVAAWLSSPGPALFVQERIGRGGKPFKMLKIRSMYADAERQRDRYEALNESDGPVFKLRKDPRVTPVGRVLRKFSIDELPQLVNVLRGEMSLVGPRPPLPKEVSAYGEIERRRLLVTPGITGVWQVSGRSNIDFANWVEMDLAYIRSWSLWLDLSLLVRTIPAVLSGRGAY
ncbi:MAG: sugar transferase [Egibacteraceae bacterium]